MARSRRDRDWVRRSIGFGSESSVVTPQGVRELAHKKIEWGLGRFWPGPGRGARTRWPGNSIRPPFCSRVSSKRKAHGILKLKSFYNGHERLQVSACWAFRCRPLRCDFAPLRMKPTSRASQFQSTALTLVAKVSGPVEYTAYLLPGCA